MQKPMLKRLIPQKKKAVFICQITEDALKVIKCLLSPKSKPQFIGLECESLPSDADNKKIAEKLNQIFKRLGYSNELVILSLPRYQATLRYLKVPSQQPFEIERIVNLQAPHYLPYPAKELVTGYAVISYEKDGYSQVNMVVVHQDIVKRLLDIFKQARILEFKIVLSSYGLYNLYHYLYPQDDNPIIMVDIDSHQAEIVIILEGKLLFSRAFRFSPLESPARLKESFLTGFIEEIMKTRDAYLKEISKAEPKKIILLGQTESLAELMVALNKETGLNVEILNYAQKINLSESLLNRILTFRNSFASLVGLGLEDIEESLNLIPADIKEATKKTLQRKEYLRLALFFLATIIIFAVAIVKNLDNKAKYRDKLKIEINKVAKEARGLEEMERRIKLLESRSQKGLSSLDVVYELHQAIPAQVALTNLSYEVDKPIILQGRSPDLNSVFVFVSEIKKSPAFKDFSIEVRYATQKKMPSGEMVDFEIICVKK